MPQHIQQGIHPSIPTLNHDPGSLQYKFVNILCEFFDLVLDELLPYGPQMAYIKAAPCHFQVAFGIWNGELQTQASQTIQISKLKVT